MKKGIKITFASLVLSLLFVTSLAAQEKAVEDFFVGKWKVMAYGLPQGDTEMMITFEKKDGKLGGNISTTDGSSEKMEFTKVELEDNSIKAYYTAQGYDVYFILEKKDNEKAEGSMMDMFDMKGTKIKN